MGVGAIMCSETGKNIHLHPWIWKQGQNRAQIGADRSGLVLIRCSDRYIMIDTASNMLIDQFVQTSSCLNNVKYHIQQDKRIHFIQSLALESTYSVG